MTVRIALAGNPNCGKTTMFNGLTGSNQYVGNWPGVTVEKKEGKLKKHEDVIITDLPGIYSLSPYTLEEVVARNYLMEEKPDAIINVVDGTNLERNLYLTTQLVELGIPIVVAINMMDVVGKNGDKINLDELSGHLGCKVIPISALKGTGIMDVADAAIQAAKTGKFLPHHEFSGPVEHAIAHIEEAVVHDQPEEKQRWYAIKIFERDEKVLEELKLSPEAMAHIEKDIQMAEEEMDDDAESIITNERYIYISHVMKSCYKKAGRAGDLTISDKIDKVVTNRFLGLPIFGIIMFLVYWIAMVGVGASATDWANDGLFGDGFHLFGNGTAAYEEVAETWRDATLIVDGYEAWVEENGVAPEESFTYAVEDEETLAVETETATLEDYKNAVATLEAIGAEPDPADYGIWVPGIPVIVGDLLERIGCADWLSGLIVDGIIGGVGAVLGFVPQMLVLFFLLAILESCGYMSRIAFVLDRIFRKFGLSGKSFICMLVGTGCGVPGIMASRTIENERDRRMTIITTTFIPCGAKVPFIAMIAGAIFGGSAWVATSAYFIGMAAIVVSGIILKKTQRFAGEPSPFVMELPAYHMPTPGNVLRSTWERGWSFIKKAGTIILLSCVLIWFLSSFGFTPDGFGMLEEDQLHSSLLAMVGSAVAWIFMPLGWGNWQAVAASVTGLIAKENIVATMGILYGAEGNVYEALASAFTVASGFSFLVFNLLCAPCFAAMGAIKREMNNTGWFLFAVGYQCGFAYVIAFLINQLGNLFMGSGSVLGVAVAVAVLAGLVYLIVRPYKETVR